MVDSQPLSPAAPGPQLRSIESLPRCRASVCCSRLVAAYTASIVGVAVPVDGATGAVFTVLLRVTG
jgi:hypothetical protein